MITQISSIKLIKLNQDRKINKEGVYSTTIKMSRSKKEKNLIQSSILGNILTIYILLLKIKKIEIAFRPLIFHIILPISLFNIRKILQQVISKIFIRKYLNKKRKNRSNQSVLRIDTLTQTNLLLLSSMSSTKRKGKKEVNKNINTKYLIRKKLRSQIQKF